MRQHSCSSASKLCASTAATTSSGSGGHSAVVPKVPSRMPRPARPAICADLGRGQPARPVAVELAQPGEGDVVDVHVEAHADGVGGDQEVDLPVLVQRHLGVAGARRQAAHHHRAAALAAADQFGDAHRPRRR